MSNDDVRKFIMSLLQKKAALPTGFHDSTDFISDGIVDSIGIIKFVLEIESRFGISISGDDIGSDEFRTVKGLVAIVDRKSAEVS